MDLTTSMVVLLVVLVICREWKKQSTVCGEIQNTQNSNRSSSVKKQKEMLLALAGLLFQRAAKFCFVLLGVVPAVQFKLGFSRSVRSNGGAMRRNGFLSFSNGFPSVCEWQWVCKISNAVYPGDFSSRYQGYQIDAKEQRAKRLVVLVA